MRNLSHQDVDDIILGSAVLAAGGGGLISEAQEIAASFKRTEGQVSLVDVDELDPEALLCTTVEVGPVENVARSFGSVHTFDCSAGKGIQIAENEINQKITGIFPGEIGPAALVRALEASWTSKDLLLVDADCLGRAAPTLSNVFSRFQRAGIPLSPIFVTTDLGESFVLDNISSLERSEELLRKISEVRNVVVVFYTCLTATLKNLLVKRSVSLALNIGQQLRHGKAEGIEVDNHIAEKNNGLVLFHGTVDNYNFRDEGGFTLGHVDLNGQGKWKGIQCHIEVKNENMAAWLDGKLVVSIPDLICLFDRAKKCIITNPGYCNGQEVSVVVLPAAKKLTTEEELSSFGPSFIGLSEDFKPILGK